MPLGRMIGISLALMAISVAAVAKTTEKGAPGHHAKPLRIGARTGRPAAASLHKAHASAHYSRREVHQVAWRHHYRRGGREEFTARQVGTDQLLDAYSGPMHTVGAQEIGEAAWYGFEGGRTASGERMDGVELTAAHRSLPLDSFAKVTNLDNGRSAIVKINDRGPVSRRFIIDLSRPAARKLGISGTAAVVVEPMAPGPVLTQTAARPQLAAAPVAPAATAAARPTIATYAPAPASTGRPSPTIAAMSYP